MSAGQAKRRGSSSSQHKATLPSADIAMTDAQTPQPKTTVALANTSPHDTSLSLPSISATQLPALSLPGSGTVAAVITTNGPLPSQSSSSLHVAAAGMPATATTQPVAQPPPLPTSPPPPLPSLPPVALVSESTTLAAAPASLVPAASSSSSVLSFSAPPPSSSLSALTVASSSSSSSSSSSFASSLSSTGAPNTRSASDAHTDLDSALSQLCDAISTAATSCSALDTLRDLDRATLEAVYGKCGFLKDVRCSMSYDKWLASLCLLVGNPYRCKSILEALGGAEALVSTMIMILYASQRNTASRNVAGELDAIDRLDLCMRLAICILKEHHLQRMPVTVLRSSDGKRILVDIDALK